MKIDVLVVGSGGREHAIGWKLKQSLGLGRLFFAPGNAGTQEIGTNIEIRATDIAGLAAFAQSQKIGLTVVGPDDPLALGIVDAFQMQDLRIFGPTKAAAQLETSKEFAKKMMERTNVPTAPFTILYNAVEAVHYVRGHFESSTDPIVLKADGLALGKGVYVCRTPTQAFVALDELMIRRIYGPAGDRVVAEKFLDGPEISIHAFCDGKTFKPFPSAQDHKSIFNYDNGPNTGGMGTISPVPWFGSDMERTVNEKIIAPILAEVRTIGTPFMGVLYPGLKMTKNGPMVLEFNARLGDPETQVYMRKLKTDLLEIFLACTEGRLNEIEIEWHDGFFVCVILASKNYPAPNYLKGVPISGVEKAQSLPDIEIFHAGTNTKDSKLVTSGGRVCGVTGSGPTLSDAIARTYEAIECIQFEGMQYRTDIGMRANSVHCWPVR